MKDACKHSSEQRELSNGIFAGDSTRAIRVKLWLELFKTAVLAFVSLFVIVLGSIAWFASNSKVDSRGIVISHQFDTVTLATKGERQQAEIDFLNMKNDDEMDFLYYDNETYYYSQQGEIALRLSDPSVAVSPGMSGEITFYIIPDFDGTQTVTLYLGLAGYEEATAGTVRKIDDIVLNSLLSGHILLFQPSESGKYSDWRPGSVTAEGVDYQITVTNSNAEAGKPWPVTIYWVWPLRYENMKGDYNGLLDAFIKAQATDFTIIDDTSYKYSQIFLTKDVNLETDELRSNAYNQADEYIGTKADYLYVTIQTDLVN